MRHNDEAIWCPVPFPPVSCCSFPGHRIHVERLHIRLGRRGSTFVEGLLHASKFSAFLASTDAAALNVFAPFLRQQTEALDHIAVQGGLAGAGTLPSHRLQEMSPRNP